MNGRMSFQAFLSGQSCKRCGSRMIGRTMSAWNSDVICLNCKAEEQSIEKALSKNAVELAEYVQENHGGSYLMFEHSQEFGSKCLSILQAVMHPPGKWHYLFFEGKKILKRETLRRLC